MHKTQNIASPSKLYSKPTRYCVLSADGLINWIAEPRAFDSSHSCDPRFSESLISSTSREIKGFVYSKTVWTDLAEQWTVQQWATGQWKDLRPEYKIHTSSRLLFLWSCTSAVSSSFNEAFFLQQDSLVYVSLSYAKIHRTASRNFFCPITKP